jgi:hypothetical protein
MSDEIAVNATRRVAANPARTVPTARVGFLLVLEGDAQDDDYAQNALRLEGDMATIGGTATKRVLEVVT